MSLNTRNVSRRYALQEFRTVGFVLILYSILVLFFPLILDELPSIFGEYDLFGYDVYKLAHVFCIVLGTVIPFFFLKLSCRKDTREKIRVRVGLLENLCNYVVFSVAVAASIFVTIMLGQYINVSGELVSSIGIAFNQDYVDDVVYIVSFILITPIIEEYAFRGSLLNCLSRYGKYFAVISTSILYALAHGSFVEMIPAFFMNIILAKMALRYKSIGPCIFVHILYNLTIYGLYSIPEKYNLYMMIGIGVMLILAFVLLVTKKYKYVTVRKSKSNKQVTLTFLSTFSVTVAMMLLILHSALLMII